MQLTPRLLFAGILSAIVLAAVIYGIILAGSPSEERDRQFDGQRVMHLQQIAGAIDAYYQLQKALPGSFEELAASRDFYIESVTDPKTRARYEYAVTGETSYKLCAVFAFDSDATPSPYAFPRQPFAVADELWKHPAGEHCFTLDAKKQEVGQACDIYRACGVGQTCAKLPGKAEAVCVVAGQECAAAGCPGSCALLESYPVQVRCEGERASANGGACLLMRETKTGQVDCLRAPAPAGWARYSAPEAPGYVGIPYACYQTDDGDCALAQ